MYSNQYNNAIKDIKLMRNEINTDKYTVVFHYDFRKLPL